MSGPGLGVAAAERLVEAYLDRHAATDLEGVLALFAPDAWLEDPVGAPRVEGREAIRGFYRATHARNGRLRFERVGPLLLGGDELVFHVRAGLAHDPGGRGMDVIYVWQVGGDDRIRSLRAFF
ncbi:MAG: nuclear transport factor 2 family protein [Myxococcota bacterium]